MYVPKEFEIRDTNEIYCFLIAHPFINLITSGNPYSTITHLPITLSKENEKWCVNGHLALANPQSESIKNNQNATCVFQGPHSYISSSLYDHENVPTYNYQAVHLQGQLQQLTDVELEQHLENLVSFFEENREKPLYYAHFSREMIYSYKREIIGFKLIVENIEAAYKLSQNRNSSDYSAIVKDLEKCPFENAKKLAEQMEKLKKGTI